MKHLPAIIAIITIFLFTVACKEEKKVDVANIDATHMPMMRTVNVNTLISDSGVVQYRIVSPLWLVYEQCDTPYWAFPKGLYLQKYDHFFNVISTVACDSARYYKNQKLWKLDGNVEMTQVPKELFQTQQLFWDQRAHTLHTDSFIHIENATHVLEGEGFRSNEKLTNYRIIRPTGIFPVENGAESPATQNGIPTPVTSAPI